MVTTLRVGGASRAVASRVGKFGLVGLLGLAVNLVVQLLLTEYAGINYLISAVLATQVSSTFNFVLAERWVFGAGGAGMGIWGRYGSFLLMNNIALLFRGR